MNEQYSGCSRVTSRTRCISLECAQCQPAVSQCCAVAVYGRVRVCHGGWWWCGRMATCSVGCSVCGEHTGAGDTCGPGRIPES